MPCKPTIKKLKEASGVFVKNPEKPYETKSDISTEGGLESNGNQHVKLQSVIDKLQDHDW